MIYLVKMVISQFANLQVSNFGRHLFGCKSETIWDRFRIIGALYT